MNNRNRVPCSFLFLVICSCSPVKQSNVQDVATDLGQGGQGPLRIYYQEDEAIVRARCPRGLILIERHLCPDEHQRVEAKLFFAELQKLLRDDLEEVEDRLEQLYALIDRTQNQMRAMVPEDEGAQDDLAELERTLDDLQADIGDITTEINELNREINDIERQADRGDDPDLLAQLEGLHTEKRNKVRAKEELQKQRLEAQEEYINRHASAIHDERGFLALQARAENQERRRQGQLTERQAILDERVDFLALKRELKHNSVFDYLEIDRDMIPGIEQRFRLTSHFDQIFEALLGNQKHIVFLAHPDYVYYDGVDQPARALENMIRKMIARLEMQTEITAGAWRTALADADALVIPSLRRPLLAELSQSARDHITSFVKNGGVLHMNLAHRPTHAFELANELFDLSLEAGSSRARNFKPLDRRPAAFRTATLPGTLSKVSAVDLVAKSSLRNRSSWILFEDEETHDGALTVVKFHDGYIVLTGWNFFAANRGTRGHRNWIDAYLELMRFPVMQ